MMLGTFLQVQGRMSPKLTTLGRDKDSPAGQPPHDHTLKGFSQPEIPWLLKTAFVKLMTLGLAYSAKHTITPFGFAFQVMNFKISVMHSTYRSSPRSLFIFCSLLSVHDRTERAERDFLSGGIQRR